jgi:4'-phosphopantetheinyl transferase
VEDAEPIAKRFFSRLECEALFQLPREERTEAFFRCWTRKEAFIKAIGEGLSRPLDRFDVSLDPGDGARLLNVLDDPSEAARWELIEIRPAPEFLAAVAIEQHCIDVRLLDFTP